MKKGSNFLLKIQKKLLPLRENPLKTKKMKKLFAMICVAVLAMGANAQVYQGQASAGLSLLYGSEIESMGIGAHFQYVVIDQLRGQVEFDSFFKHNNTNWYDVSINAEYLVALKTDMLYLYPIAGVTYSMVTYKAAGIKDEENHVGLNAGAGLEYEINDHFAATVEYRHTIMRKVDQGVFAIGLNYKF